MTPRLKASTLMRSSLPWMRANSASGVTVGVKP